jgi:hypothetical protein
MIIVEQTDRQFFAKIGAEQTKLITLLAELSQE